jgi:hypothetical protein
MKILKIAGIGLVALFVLVTAVAYLLPTSVVVQRSVVVDAPPETIYSLIANLEEGWPEWSPWNDPKYQIRYSGPKEGVGATSHWQDNGDNQLTIVKADPKKGAEFDLVMMNESFRMKSSLLCEPRGGGKTEVTWSDDIDYSDHLYYRYFGLILDGALGEQMDQGLTKLKTKAETRAKAALTAEKPVVQ